MSALACLISCEHGGNTVPPDLIPLFANWREQLLTHRGYDLGALETARALAKAIDAPLYAAATTRLVVDLNRSIGHPDLFSKITTPLSRIRHQELLAIHYHPHRQAVTKAVADLLDSGKTVLHLASHSFTPCLDGVTRHCDVGCLYDPRRSAEKKLCLTFLQELAGLDHALILRRNYPYRGVTDGLVTRLRRQFGERYLGVELEVNQRFVLAGDEALSSINTHLAEALVRTLGREATGA
jgi:predicted N-formylglutamate amidohydrolase